ncbi:MAG: hypothetical protein R8J94_23420 [Acidimicrobiia bacterium]|nr:hypothetical protein [Acidimicrobiia bacterium]
MSTKSTSPQRAASQTQLLLVTEEKTSANHWKLDDETRQVGLKGLAQARAVLQASRPAVLDLAA